MHGRRCIKRLLEGLRIVRRLADSWLREWLRRCKGCCCCCCCCCCYCIFMRYPQPPPPIE
ncbi:hypothetical protein EJ04DRAFT_52870 [Polyplosphaeria fusca]|uniref:Uncharacterized protein n=1 Tax=Polyplosphaeria fusca TaxID=682080 RepID=A0A9P4V3F9_9PLEO|nr:hypothetical protein EJ04DRAFT_52870 [Polyplosphaeria fusca]